MVGVVGVQRVAQWLMERLTRHHIFYERPDWREASEEHRQIRSTPGLIVRIPADLHNQGRESLHANCPRTVPLISQESAIEIVGGLSDIKPGRWLHNIDLMNERLVALGEVATAEHLMMQREFVLKALIRAHFNVK